MTPIGQKHPAGVRNRRILIALLVLLALLLLSATIALALRVRWASAPVATATPLLLTATPDPITPAPTLTTAPPVINPALLDLRTGVSVTLPAGWQSTVLDADSLRQTVSAIGNNPAQTLLLALGDEAVALVATLDQATSLTVVTVQRNDLSLNRYLEDVRAGLQAQGAVVHQTSVEIDLRNDGLPVATLHYTLAPGAGTSPLDGYQVIAYDATATQLVLFTFTTPSPRYAELLPRFQAAVRSADF